MMHPEARWEPGDLTWTEFAPGPDSTAVTEEVEPPPRKRVGFRPPDDKD